MRISKLLVVLLALLVAIAGACMPVQPEGTEPAAAAHNTEAPIYAQRGPHAAGYTPLVIGAESERPLDAGLWYPALNPTGVEESVTYDITIKSADMQNDNPPVVYGQALLDAPVDGTAGPYPLVVFSHGFGLNAPSYHTLLEHFASHGFVVLAPEHVEDDWFDGVAHTVERLQDLEQTVDYAETLNAPDSELAGLIDLENVAAVGHSYGGYTALATAGAQIDFGAFNERCGALAEDAPEMFLCMPLLGKEADLAARAGLDAVPQGLWPSFADPRITAILPMAGDAFLFDQAGLAAVTVPMMAIGGTGDTGTPFDWGSGLTYDSVSSAHRSLVALEGAEHMIVSSPCDDMPWLAGSPYADYLCFDPAWDKQEALDLVHHFSTAFLLDTLRSDSEAKAALSPDAAQYDGVRYEAVRN